MAEEVTEGLRRCGFALDPHGVLARYKQWRMSLSAWKAVFADCLEGKDLERMARASVAFDYRQVAGELYVDLALNEIIREAPEHKGFMSGLAQLGTRTRTPLGFRQKLEGWIDIKKDGLVPIQNLARYYAFSRGITAHRPSSASSRYARPTGVETVAERSLRESYLSMRTCSCAITPTPCAADRELDNIIKVSELRPLTRATLQEAMREVGGRAEPLPAPGRAAVGAGGAAPRRALRAADSRPGVRRRALGAALASGARRRAGRRRRVSVGGLVPAAQGDRDAVDAV